MVAALAAESDNPPPPPPAETDKKTKSKDRSDSEGKSYLHQLLGFDPTSIPGIGYGTANIIFSELGTNFDCFPDERHFASYIGLAPSLGKSAGKNALIRYE